MENQNLPLSFNLAPCRSGLAHPDRQFFFGGGARQRPGGFDPGAQRARADKNFLLNPLH